MRKPFAALPMVLLSLAAVLCSQEAGATERGRKLLENKTDKTIVLDMVIRAPGNLPFLTAGGRMTVELVALESKWREYDGTYLNSITVDGGVRCEVKTARRGDWADTLLNTNMGLTVEKQGSGCIIRGYNPR